MKYTYILLLFVPALLAFLLVISVGAIIGEFDPREWSWMCRLCVGIGAYSIMYSAGLIIKGELERERTDKL